MAAISPPTDAALAAAIGVPPAALAATAPALEGDATAVAAAVRAWFAHARPDPASFPSVALQILELVRYPDVDLNELAKYIRVDGALAGGVLALANSAAYRAVRRIDTVKDAVARLGVSEVARVAAAISVRSLYGSDATAAHLRHAPVFTRLFLHAATVARCAAELAKRGVAATPGAETVFMAGLLHDVGRAVALRALAELERHRKVAELDAAASLRVVEEVHVELGGAVHETWRLPRTLTAVAAHHHDPSTAPDDLRACVHLVGLVSALDLHRREPGAHPRAPAEIAGSARALGLDADRVKALGAELDAAEAWVRTVFPG